MLLRAVPERMLGALFGSDQVAEILHNHLTELPQFGISKDAASVLYALRSQLTIAVQSDVDQRTSRRHRLNELEAAAQKLYPQNFLKSKEFPLLDTVFKELMEWRGSAISFIPEHVQRYAELVSELDPTVLVAWQLAKIEDSAVLKEAVENMTTLFVNSIFFDSPFADNHSHLGGITGDDVVLAEIVLLKQVFDTNQNEDNPEVDLLNSGKEKPPLSPNVIRINRIHLMLSAFVELWKAFAVNETTTVAQYESELIDACLHDAMSTASYMTFDWTTENAGIIVDSAEVTSRWMVKQMASAASCHDIQKAWMWLFILLWRTYRLKTSSATISAAVLLFVTDVMVLRRQLIMDGNGLRRFTTGYPFSPLRVVASKSKEWKNLSYRESARRTFARAGDKAELKISAGNFGESDPLTEQFSRVANERIQFIHLKDNQDSDGNTAPGFLDHWHFCLHFNRSGKKGRYVRRQKLWEEARLLKKFLGSKSVWKYVLPLEASGGEISSRFLPSQFVRALDVAGDETKWPIEVFSPMLRWVRYQENVKDLMGMSCVPPTWLHLSIHAGEDYTHPLSGLRNIDETVTFTGMTKGDRIGHGLALGIPPADWLHRHGDVLLPVDEHVDNLVWAWQKAQELGGVKNLEVAPILQRIEKRITRFLPYVSWISTSKTVCPPKIQDLYRAWQYRLNCPTLILEQHKDLQIGSSSLKVGAPDYDILCAQLGNPDLSTAEGIYVHRAISERDVSTVSGRQIITVRLTYPRHGHPSRAQVRLEELGPNNLSQMYDHDNALDLKFMMALQDLCIERYAQTGISIETNPSSNVYIGQIETHSDHPIYRWFPLDMQDLESGKKYNEFGLRTLRIPVTINTDDQGIIPTTLRMEYHLMHEAALDHGHSEPVADEWIEELRKIGMQHFNEAHYGNNQS